jgi:anhydro-N-acetylmuramic acid kinase
MDAWIFKHKGVAYDKDGQWAASGKVIPRLLQGWLSESFFTTPPPKSSGRDLFNLHWLERHLQGDEAAEDVQATLLALTTHGIVNSIQRYCEGTQEVYLCGGGAYNQELLNNVSRRCHIAASSSRIA